MRNGVQHHEEPQPQGRFQHQTWSWKRPARLEGLLTVVILSGVLVIAGRLFVMPGPLVVSIRDQLGRGVRDARVSCVGPGAHQQFSGLTDVAGEAKWPGLDKGLWQCQVWLPPDFFAPAPLKLSGAVQPRRMALLAARVERSPQLLVQVERPRQVPRFTVAVRVVCPPERGMPATAWEGRTTLVSGLATLPFPAGRTCRAGLVRPELPAGAGGPATQTTLSCETQPCTGELLAGVGKVVEATLTPTREQLLAARPSTDE